MTCSWTSSPTRPSWNWSSLETAQPLVSRTNMYKDVHLLLLFISRLLSNLWRTDVYIPQSLFFFNMCWMCLQTACMSQPLGPLTCVVPVYFPETDCFLRLFAVLSSWFFFFFTKDYDKKSWFFFLVKVDKLNAILFFRSNVRDRNTESYGPEGESDGLLRHHSTDRLLQWHSEHCTLGSWTFPGQKVQSLTLAWKWDIKS